MSQLTTESRRTAEYTLSIQPSPAARGFFWQMEDTILVMEKLIREEF
jgi:hypothetical protein